MTKNITLHIAVWTNISIMFPIWDKFSTCFEINTSVASSRSACESNKNHCSPIYIYCDSNPMHGDQLLLGYIYNLCCVPWNQNVSFNFTEMYLVRVYAIHWCLCWPAYSYLPSPSDAYIDVLERLGLFMTAKIHYAIGS